MSITCPANLQWKVSSHAIWPEGFSACIASNNLPQAPEKIGIIFQFLLALTASLHKLQFICWLPPNYWRKAFTPKHLTTFPWSNSGAHGIWWTVRSNPCYFDQLCCLSISPLTRRLKFWSNVSTIVGGLTTLGNVESEIVGHFWCKR